MDNHIYLVANKERIVIAMDECCINENCNDAPDCECFYCDQVRKPLEMKIDIAVKALTKLLFVHDHSMARKIALGAIQEMLSIK